MVLVVPACVCFRPRAVVIRDGMAADLEAKGLVVGDVVSLSSGNSPPADIRLIEVRVSCAVRALVRTHVHCVRALQCSRFRS